MLALEVVMAARLPNLFVPLGVALVLVILAPQAQTANSGISGPPQAPVGHRQPSARDVPEGETSAEAASKKLNDELDRKLKSICRGC